MNELPVGRIRLDSFFLGPLARVLNAEARGYDEDLAHGLLTKGL